MTSEELCKEEIVYLIKIVRHPTNLECIINSKISSSFEALSVIRALDKQLKELIEKP
jgi:hypothetical protein